MKVFYTIPECNNNQDERLCCLLYECFKYKIMWELRDLENVIIKEGGSIFLDQTEDGPQYRFEGFSKNLEILIRYKLSKMKNKTLLNLEGIEEDGYDGY